MTTLKKHVRFDGSLVISFFLLLLSVSCTQKTDNTTSDAEQIKIYQDSITVLNDKLEKANAQIEILKFPADQRLAKIVDLFNAEDFDNVRKEVAELEKIFPNAKENAEAKAYITKIEEIEAAKKAEEERMKALGYKAFEDKTTITIGKTTYSFSGFTYGRTFTFEYVQDVDEYYYEVADKDCTYILASLAISTKENYASTPNVYACEIVDGNLKKIDDFRIEYASYSTYGAKIGNYSETSHDFSKVSSVKYKMAAQIPQAYTNKPIVIVVHKASGSLSDNISIDEVREKFEVIKILNRNKL